MKYGYLLFLYVATSYGPLFCMEQEKLLTFDGASSMAYINFPLEIRKKIQEEPFLYLKKIEIEDQKKFFPLYCNYAPKGQPSFLKWIRYGENIDARLLYFLDADGKEHVVGKAGQKASVVGPFKIEDKNYVAEDTEEGEKKRALFAESTYEDRRLFPLSRQGLDGLELKRSSNDTFVTLVKDAWEKQSKWDLQQILQEL